MPLPKFEVFKSSKDGKHYFRLLAGNGEIVCQSEAYGSRADAHRGCAALMAIVKTNPPIEDSVS